MAIDKKAYALANGYTDETVIGGGAIKGKNCTISKIEDIDGGHRITFGWTLDNGTTKSQTLDVKDGADGHTPVKGVDYYDGEKGEPGNAGLDGKDGTTYTPSIGQVTTVESNVEASASVSVNTETKEAVFNFAIPKGKDGDRNADTVNNHTVESDVPVDAKFTDTIYDDTEVKKRISDNGYGEVAGGKNLLNHNIIDSKITNCSVLFKNDTFYATNKGNYSLLVLSVPTIVGKSYTVTIKDWSDYSYRCIASVSDLSDNTLVSMVITDATLSMTFTAVGTESLINISPNNTPNEMSNTITFKCMLEEGSVATEYEPYFPSNKMLAEEVNQQNESLKNDKADKSEVCVNLLKPTLSTVTRNGITCTNNGDGTYTLNGTAGADVNAEFILYGSSNLVELNKEFRLTGCPSNTYAYLFVGDWGVPWELYGKDTGNGSNFKITTNSPDKRVSIMVPKGVTVDNLVFKPMITTNLNATYDDFVPYTGSTGQLNSDVAELTKSLGNTDISAIGDGTVTGAISTVNSNLDELSDYSTEEKVIGTWIDGKPIYRKVINFNLGETTQDVSTAKIIDNIPNISAIIDVKGYIKWKKNSDGGTVSIPYTHLSGTDFDQIFTIYNYDNGNIKFSYFLKTLAFDNQDAQIVIEYIKE